MDPRRVLTFRAVARARSFTRAAEELALSQPSVSQQVAALEAEVGARLIDRAPGGLRLTAAGDVLLAHADAVAERLALARGQLAELAAQERVRLRLGAFPSALAGLVPGAVARLREQVPGAQVVVDEAPMATMPGRVAAGDLHLAIAFQDAALPRREPEELERVDLMTETFRVLLRADHPAAATDPVDLAALAGEQWTAPSTDGLVVRACREAGFEPQLVSITREQTAVRALVLGGMAVALVPGLAAEAYPGLAVRAIAGAGPRRDVYVLLPPGGRHPLTAPALDALREVAAMRTA